MGAHMLWMIEEQRESEMMSKRVMVTALPQDDTEVVPFSLNAGLFVKKLIEFIIKSYQSTSQYPHFLYLLSYLQALSHQSVLRNEHLKILLEPRCPAMSSISLDVFKRTLLISGMTALIDNLGVISVFDVDYRVHTRLFNRPSSKLLL